MTLALTRTSLAAPQALGQSVWLDDISRKMLEEALADFERDKVIERLWARDVSLWKSEPEHAKAIADALGWLTVVDKVRPHADELKRFGDEIAGPGFSHVVVMGMGGSSSGIEVLRRTNGRVAGRPELIVLDRTCARRHPSPRREDRPGAHALHRRQQKWYDGRARGLLCLLLRHRQAVEGRQRR